MKKLIYALLITGTVLGSTEKAYSVDVRKLLSWCGSGYDSVKHAYNHGYCAGMMRGVFDTLAVTAQVCEIPTTGAVRQAFINWAKANSSEGKLDGAFGVLVAIVETWPCE